MVSSASDLMTRPDTRGPRGDTIRLGRRPLPVEVSGLDRKPHKTVSSSQSGLGSQNTLERSGGQSIEDSLASAGHLVREMAF